MTARAWAITPLASVVASWLAAGAVTSFGLGCGSQIDAGGDGAVDPIDDDPLAIADTPAPGSLDEIHQLIIAERCSGQPGLCHNGQFEPNLSTPALTYAYLVNRPALEDGKSLRVAPGDPDASFLIDKLRGRDVSTLMPLGADPLTEDEIRMIEGWIRDGALRTPGADPAPTLNNPPVQPQIAVFDGAGNRLDAGGAFTVAVGQQLVFRHTVQDFETDDADIPIAVILLAASDGRNVVLSPAAPKDRHLAQTSFDAGGPPGIGDQLNYRFDFTVPASLDLTADDGVTSETVPARGLTLTPVVLYIDQVTGDGIVSFSIGTSPLTVE